MSSVREVAKRSGVSTATVSRVLNGDAASVSEATRDRVLLAVRELNYRVRPAPRAGSEARTAMIAVLVADVDGHPLSDENNGYFSGVFDGVLAEAATLGYSTIVHIERMWHDVGQVVRRTFDGHCDGVLFVGTSDQTPTVRALWERGVPLVIAGAMPSLPNVSSVDITNERSAFEATTELIRQGHRRIAYFGPDGDVVSSVERRAGYRRALAVAGLAPREYLSEGWAVRRPSSSTVEPDEGGSGTPRISSGRRSTTGRPMRSSSGRRAPPSAPRRSSGARSARSRGRLDLELRRLSLGPRGPRAPHHLRPAALPDRSGGRPSPHGADRPSERSGAPRAPRPATRRPGLRRPPNPPARAR